MNASCCHDCGDDDPQRGNPAYRRVLWLVLAINAVMFAVEIGAGLAAGSASLQADALDFLGDAGNYAISLFVVGMALRYRAMAAFAKGTTMAVLGLWVLAITAWHAWHGTLPQALTMGVVGFSALAANAVSFGLLWRHRGGDANMRSAWICTRNDVLGNLAVLLAALGVFGTGTGWPDVLVAAIMACLALQGAFTVIRQAGTELQSSRRPIAFPVEQVMESAMRPKPLVHHSMVTCPACGTAKTEQMPLDACQIVYECAGCGATLRPKSGDCCVFCSYGSVPCPPIQAERSRELA
jgi:Co/Zn/Cd efflux system component